MIDLRPPRQGDEHQVAALLHQLGYDLPAADLRARLLELPAWQADPALVATEDDGLLGIVVLHWTRMLHLPRPVARITTLVVDAEARGRGIGRALVEAAARLASQAGCGTLEVTTALRRADAQAFYRGTGFEESSLHLRRALPDPPRPGS